MEAQITAFCPRRREQKIKRNNKPGNNKLVGRALTHRIPTVFFGGPSVTLCPKNHAQKQCVIKTIRRVDGIAPDFIP